MKNRDGNDGFQCRLFFRSLELWPERREVNDIKRTRFSCGRIIWLLPHPFTPSDVSKLSPFSVFLCIAGRTFGGRAGRERVRAKSYDSEKTWSSINHWIKSSLALVTVAFCTNTTTKLWSKHIFNSELKMSKIVNSACRILHKKMIRCWVNLCP